MRVDDVRAVALALPGTTERPHFELTSFRVGTKIFATVPPGQDVVHVFVADELARAVAQEHPETVELLWWGKRLSGVRIRLAPPGDPSTPVDDRLDGDQQTELVTELLTEAWRRKAPRALVAERDGPDL